jgi:hypothetical protein
MIKSEFHAPSLVQQVCIRALPFPLLSVLVCPSRRKRRICPKWDKSLWNRRAWAVGLVKILAPPREIAQAYPPLPPAPGQSAILHSAAVPTDRARANLWENRPDLTGEAKVW